MPITVDKKLAAIDILRQENIFVMDNMRADHQDIRPMNVLIVNLMPKKAETEVHLLRNLANTPLQMNVDFLYMTSHQSKNTGRGYLETFYKTFADIKDKFFDGMIVTGAPVEQMAFEEVDYWRELCDLFNWSRSHVYSTLHLCWGAQAGLYYRYGIDKRLLPHKLSGVYEQDVLLTESPLMRGFDDAFLAPHSRHTEVALEDVRRQSHLQVLAAGEQVGLSILSSRDMREVYSFGHLEYGRETLSQEYHRDQKAGLSPQLPINYFPQDQANQQPRMRWSLAASTFFSNWMNYAVYQETPYRLEQLQEEVAMFGYL